MYLISFLALILVIIMNPLVSFRLLKDWKIIKSSMYINCTVALCVFPSYTPKIRKMH